MDWLIGSKHGEAKRLIIQLSNATERERVAPILVQMLNDPEREVKKQVIQSLGELKDPRTLPALQEIASNRADRELHTLAKEVLDKIS